LATQKVHALTLFAAYVLGVSFGLCAVATLAGHRLLRRLGCVRLPCWQIWMMLAEAFEIGCGQFTVFCVCFIAAVVVRSIAFVLAGWMCVFSYVARACLVLLMITL